MDPMNALDALRELVAAHEARPANTGTRRWLDALAQARNVLAEADKPAPVHDLLSLRMIAHRKGYSITEDARAGCFNIYDNPDGHREEAAHAFCVSLREVAELLDTLPDLGQPTKGAALASHLFDLGCSLNRVGYLSSP